MNSKKKNKNRQNKPPNPTPPQKQDVSEPSIPPEVLNTEIESVVEERVPNIISENMTTEVKETEETPKKPKRNRGKKKKEDERSDIEDEKNEEPVLNAEIEPMKESLNEAIIAPTARKKKNKNKKGQSNVEVIEETKTENKELHESSNQPQETAAIKVGEQEQEIKSSKKKNKKKKNRNDSEKSDKVEEVTCTSAFQKLLVDDGKTQTLPQPSTDDSSISEATVKEVETNITTTTPQSQPLQKDEGNKNKKKNKKDKKHPIDVATDTELSQSSDLKAEESVKNVSNVFQGTHEAISKEIMEVPKTDEATPSTSSEDDKNSKLKAKIAKPVDKKKKGKGNENISEENLEKNVLVAKEENAEKLKDTEIESKQETSPKESEDLLTDDLDDVILIPLTEMTPDWQEEVKIEEGNGPVIGCEEKTETLVTGQSVSIDKNKTRKKSPKPQRKIGTPESFDVSSGPSKPEESSLETSSSSKEQAEQKPAVKLDVIPETKLEDKPESVKGIEENFEITTNIEKCDIVSPIQSKELVPETMSSTEMLSDVPNLDIITQKDKNEKEHHKPDIEVTGKASSSESKTEHIQVADKDKRNRKKSPKPQRKTEEALNPVTRTETVHSGITHIAEEAIPVSSSEILPQESEELPKIEDVLVEQKEFKSHVEQMPGPHSEKRHKRKKSPKPIVGRDAASGSKDTQKSKQNVIKIEDIIIIQAEVVSDEKAQASGTFVATQDITAKQDVVDKVKIEHDNEKSKKRKKSPKPPQKDNKESASLLETPVKIEIPVTPETQLSPNVVAFELETPQTDPVASPSDATPDFIEYPRCSSEHLDTNNNMMIQEIIHPEAKFDTPFIIHETPVTQSSINSPERVATAPNVMNKEEKTDLKSKVMEVNQDMEELRLSIERSLAEFTSLEKSDRDVERNIKEENIENAHKIAEVKAELPTQDKLNENVPVENVADCVQAAAEVQPICPARKEHKGKGKSKKKGKQESTTQMSQTQSSQQLTTVTETSTKSQDTKTEDSKSEQKSDYVKEKQKQQAGEKKENKDDDVIVNDDNSNNYQPDFEPIENFEDAMTSSVDDVNKTFEMIVNEVNPRLSASDNNPEISVTEPQEENKDSRQDKQNPVSPPKNLLGHPDIPVPSNRTDYKKEKNKPPNTRQAKVKIKDANQVEIEASQKNKQSKESQTEAKTILNYKRPDESICVTNQNDDYIYKYSFRKVFLQCACHVCKKDLTQTRVPCCYCNLIFYCNQKHKDEDYTQHQALCFAVSTIVHLKDLKFLYADARDVTGHNYRLLRMQMIVSCEKVLKRRLAPWEQEALLYPRMCGHPSCREWRQGNLMDCDGCGQISYCSEHPDHLPKSHSRWCKSYNLYRALVKYQQTKGRLEPKLPTKVVELSPLPDNINEVLASMYEEKIDMSDIEYAALTQLATAPLTALFCLQHKPNINGITKKSTLTVHIVGAELQFEADVLNKWEVFLLHLMPEVKELRVVLVGPDLNPSNLPVELLGKIKFCENCRQTKRQVVFGFQDKRTYHQFWASEDFTAPDLVCAFNPSIQRSSTYNGKDTWPFTLNCILKLKVPFAITSHTLSELTSDLLRIQECASVAYNVVLAPKHNSFASVRPDRNFISDDEAPLLFKNHCVAVVCGV